MAAGGGEPQRVRTGSIGPVLTFQDSAISVIGGSFCLLESERSPSGYTVYKLQFKVQTDTPQGQPVIEECECWKRYSDFLKLSKQLEHIQNISAPSSSSAPQEKLPELAKANYFDRFKESVIEERRVSAETLLQYCSYKIHLVTSAPFFEFIKGAAVIRILPVSELISSPTGQETPPQSDWISRQSSSTTPPEVSVRMSILEERDEGGDTREEEGGVALEVGGAEADLPLPSTPKTPEISLIRHQQGDSSVFGGSDWWSNALAQSDVINCDDYDSLMREEEEEAYVTTDGTASKDKTLESESGSSNKSVGNLSPPRKPVDQAERRLSPSSSSSSSLSSNGAYVVQAGKLITQGLEYESTGQLDESFDLFKAGVDVLLNGVQTDMNSSRREAVRQKTAEYLQYAEILQRKMIKKKQKLELNRSESSSSNARPHLLQDFKVVSIIANKVLLTESKHTGQRFVFKVLHKQLSVQDRTQVVRGRIPRSKNRTPSQCPYMVKLLHHYETVSNRIFLLLEHIKNGRLVHHVQSIRDHQLGRRLQEREERRRRKREKKRLREQGEELARIVIGQESSTLSPGPPLSPNVSSESLNMTQSPISLPHSHGSPNQDPPPTLEPKNEDDYIQYLMDNLSPPTELPVTSSIGSSIGGGSGDGDEEDEKEDMLDVLRKQMEELCKEDEEELSSKATREDDADDSAILDREDEAEIQAILTGGDGKENDDSLSKEDDGSLIEDTNKEDDDLLGDQEQLLELEKHLSAFTSLSAPDNNSDLLQLNLSQDNDNTTTADPTDIVPSSSNDDIHTSTDPPNTSSSNNEDKGSSKPDVIDNGDKGSQEEIITNGIDASSGKDSVTNEPVSADNDNNDNTSSDQSSSTTINVVPPTPTTPTSQPRPIPAKPSASSLSGGGDVSRPAEGIKKLSSRQSTPQFSPVVSLRGSPETGPSQEWEKQLDSDIKKWAAQLVIALEHLHSNGIICRDLHSDNILINDSGDVRLTYFGQWDYIPNSVKTEAVQRMYVAPELSGLDEATVSADWWSLGAILFELLTGELLVHCHPGGIHSHIPIVVPGKVSPEAKSLIEQLLQVNPLERIGSGLNGTDDIKSHPFFSTIDWKSLYNQR